MESHWKLALATGTLVAALGSCPTIAAPLQQAPGAAARPDDVPVTAQTTVRVRGTIQRYEAASRRLRVTTTSGPVEFSVPSSAHVTRRGTTIDARELEHLTGSGAVVRYYSESDGRLIVRSIHVLASSETPKP